MSGRDKLVKSLRKQQKDSTEQIEKLTLGLKDSESVFNKNLLLLNDLKSQMAVMKEQIQQKDEVLNSYKAQVEELKAQFSKLNQKKISDSTGSLSNT